MKFQCNSWILIRVHRLRNHTNIIIIVIDDQNLVTNHIETEEEEEEPVDITENQVNITDIKKDITEGIKQDTMETLLDIIRIIKGIIGVTVADGTKLLFLFFFQLFNKTMHYK
uniref:Uncharacterized protein n=1 Tax=Caenorhabditis tropicalis TaxID=1561998 RepID=A0A1I7T1D0_9PELO